MLVALERAVRTREEVWTVDREMAAVRTELTHASLLAFLRANGAKNVGNVLTIPRPGQEEQKPPMMTMGQFARKSRSGNV